MKKAVVMTALEIVNMNKSLFLLCGVGLVGVANAQLVIDDFSTGNYSKTITSGSDLAFQSGTMVGGDRFAETIVESNPLGLEIQTDILGGTYSVSSQPQMDGMGKVGYGYAASGSGVTNDDLNLDLSSLNAFRINVLSSDQPGSLMVTVRSSSSNGGVAVSSTTALLGDMVNVPHSIDVDFSSFAGIDFSDIDQMEFKFDTTPSADLTVGSVEAVPEPGTMAVLASAGLLALRKRRKQK